MCHEMKLPGKEGLTTMPHNVSRIEANTYHREDHHHHPPPPSTHHHHPPLTSHPHTPLFIYHLDAYTHT